MAGQNLCNFCIAFKMSGHDHSVACQDRQAIGNKVPTSGPGSLTNSARHGR
jgi:hypothetical protein